MINLDVLIKYVREYITSNGNWPEKVWDLKTRIDTLLLDFPGIGCNCLSFIPFEELKDEDIFILDPKILEQSPYDPPLMLGPRDENSGLYLIIGIGKGNIDIDPDYYKVGSSVSIPWAFYDKHLPVLRVDCRPDENGGPGYHYFYRVGEKDRR